MSRSRVKLDPGMRGFSGEEMEKCWSICKVILRNIPETGDQYEKQQ